MLNFLRKKQILPPRTYNFPRGKIVEIANTPVLKQYKIISDDGDRSSHLVLRIENLEALSLQILNAAVACVGNIKEFRQLYTRYRNIMARQKPPIDCDRRFVLSWVQENKEELAWVIDFRTTLSDQLGIQRIFPAFANYQFPEEPDWYLHVVLQDWVETFTRSIREGDISALSPLRVNLTEKRIRAQKRAIIEQRLRLYWKQQGLGEANPVVTVNIRQPQLRIPYEAIASLILEKHRHQQSG